MQFDLVANSERDETIQAGERCVARGAMDHGAFAKEKTRKVGAVLSGYAGGKGHPAR
jgi:hypothetical protein